MRLGRSRVSEERIEAVGEESVGAREVMEARGEAIVDIFGYVGVCMCCLLLCVCMLVVACYWDGRLVIDLKHSI